MSTVEDKLYRIAARSAELRAEVRDLSRRSAEIAQELAAIDHELSTWVADHPRMASRTTVAGEVDELDETERTAAEAEELTR